MKVSIAAGLVLAGVSTCALAQASGQPPLKLGLIVDMSGPYSDITGKGSVAAAQMAADDFGKTVLGRPIEVLGADHQNKADNAAAKAREWFDSTGVEAIMDVAASATALAVNEIARERNKIVLFSGPGATALTNEACAPYSVHWAYDTYALAHGTALATVKAGYKNWFFLTADYAFGRDLEKNSGEVVKAEGGKVLGEVRHPLNTTDFSSYLLQGQASGANVIALANAGADMINAIKQAHEFGIVQGGQSLAGMLVFISDVHSMGLDEANGLLLTTAFYWDMNDETRAFSKRFQERTGQMPDMSHAGVYSSTMHYLKAVAKAGTTEPAAVMKVMKDTPVNDVFAKNGRIREDGRMVHDMYLFQVKKKSESTGPWDYYKLLGTIPADSAFLPLDQSKCKLVKAAR